MKFVKQQKQVFKQLRKHPELLIAKFQLKIIKGGCIVEADAEGF